jgi:hypothetical protein
MIDNFFHPLIRLDIGPLEYFSVLGRALFTAQHFETNCRALAGFLNMRIESGTKGLCVLDTPEFRDKIDKLWKQTLGCDIHYLKKNFEFPNEIAKILDDARDARNEIAHWATVGIGDDLDSEVDMRVDEIRARVDKIAAADKYIAALIHAANKDPLPTPQFFLAYDKKVADWVCEAASDE